jgi:hypothetical protein
MKKMIHTRRYGGMKLTGYVNDIDTDFQSQFSAVTCLLGDGTAFVAFRGTDNTIVGWKEDFNMSFLHQTPGQIKAAEYLDQNFYGKNVTLRVGGHSKGGNFAVYASVFCRDAIKEHILQVYSNDGPGFLKETTELEAYRRMLPKIVSTIPESSIVGMLLENPLAHRVVKSSQIGVMQHDAMSWEVMANHFVLTDNVSQSSLMLDETLKHWIYGLEVEQRRQFVDALFDALDATGATTIDELPANKLQLINEITRSFSNLPTEQQQILRYVLMRFAFSGGETIASKAYSKAYTSGETLAFNMQEMWERLKPSEAKLKSYAFHKLSKGSPVDETGK